MLQVIFEDMVNEKDSINPEIICRLSTILGKKKLKVAEVAEMAGISETTLHNLYHDKIKKLDLVFLAKLCIFLGISIDELLEIKPHKDI